MTRPRSVAFAAILTLYWPPGEGPTTTNEPAVDREVCATAAQAALVGRGLPLGRTHPALSALCTPTATGEAAGFAPGWNCIKNYGCLPQ